MKTIKQIYLRIKYLGKEIPWVTICNVCWQEFSGMTKRFRRKPSPTELQEIDNHMRECRNATTN